MSRIYTSFRRGIARSLIESNALCLTGVTWRVGTRLWSDESSNETPRQRAFRDAIKRKDPS